MKDNRRISENKLEEMLTNYCNRKPERVFELRKENQFMKKSAVFKLATAGVCAATVFTVGLFSNNIPLNFESDTDSTIQQLKNSFIIDACAVEAGSMDVDFVNRSVDSLGGVGISTDTSFFLNDEEKTMLVGEQLVEYLTSGESQYNGYDVLSKDDLVLESYAIAIDVSGNNIVNYSVESENGELFFYDTNKEDIYHSLETVDTPNSDVSYLWSAEFDLYMGKVNSEFGAKFENVSLEDVKENNLILEWSPSLVKFANDMNEVAGDGITYENCDLRIATANELLKTAEDYTKYFGDTVTITVNYEDGTSMTKKVVITLNAEGQYQIEY